MKAAAATAKWSGGRGSGGGSVVVGGAAAVQSACATPEHSVQIPTILECRDTGLQMTITQHNALPGQFLVEDFISEEEEATLLAWVDTVEGGGNGVSLGSTKSSTILYGRGVGSFKQSRLHRMLSSLTRC